MFSYYVELFPIMCISFKVTLLTHLSSESGLLQHLFMHTVHCAENKHREKNCCHRDVNHRDDEQIDGWIDGRMTR